MAFGYQVLGFGSGVAAGDATAPEVAWLGDRGVYCGAATNQAIDVIEYIKISSAGNSTDFGNMTAGRYAGGACSNGTRLCYGGGFDYSVVSYNVIQYLTIASTGNMSDFGDLTVSRTYLGSAAANATIGMWMGGHDGVSSSLNTVDKVNIASTGNATDFGDLSAARALCAGTGNGTRAIIMGGQA